MKARITIAFATAVVALAVAGGALAAPQQNTIRGWSHGTGGAKTWAVNRPGTVKPWNIRGWAVKPNPSGARGSYQPNPSGARRFRPNPTSIRGGATPF
jgi:hypothetical protein